MSSFAVSRPHHLQALLTAENFNAQGRNERKLTLSGRSFRNRKIKAK